MIHTLYRKLRNLDALKQLQADLSLRIPEAAGLTNLWWMACKVVGIPGGSSGGRFRDAVKGLKRGRKFRVTDGERLGVCYAMYDHFDVYWDDGNKTLGIGQRLLY